MIAIYEKIFIIANMSSLGLIKSYQVLSSLIKSYQVLSSLIKSYQVSVMYSFVKNQILTISEKTKQEAKSFFCRGKNHTQKLKHAFCYKA